MKNLTPWDITYAVNMALACGISYAIITQVLVPFVDRSDALLGGMWAVVATIFVFRETRESTLPAGLARLIAHQREALVPTRDPRQLSAAARASQQKRTSTGLSIQEL